MGSEDFLSYLMKIVWKDSRSGSVKRSMKKVGKQVNLVGVPIAGSQLTTIAIITDFLSALFNANKWFLVKYSLWRSF